MTSATRQPTTVQRRPARQVLILVLAAAIPLFATRILSAWNVPLGKPGKFVYLYSPLQPLRLLHALPMLLVAAAGAAAVLLAADARPPRRRTGLLLGAAVAIATACWSYLAPPAHLSQHVFTLRSPSHDGAFVDESARIASWRDYLADFHNRARTPEHVMRGTRVISNPPGTTLLALALRRAVQRSPALARFASRGFADDFEGLGPATLEHAQVAVVFAWTLTALWAASALTLYALARLFFDPAPALALALCALISPMTLTLTPGKDPAQLLTASAALWLWMRAARRSSVVAAALAGVAGVVALGVGLVHAWIGAVALVATIWHAARSPDGLRRHLLRCVLPGLLAFIAAAVALRLAADWNIVTTTLAVARSQAHVTRGPGSMPLAWQALGVPLFLLFCGPALWTVALWRLADHAADEPARLGGRLLALAALVMLATVGFTNAETPRLWIPFLPLLLLGAALRCRVFAPDGRGRARLLAALVACQIAASAIQWSFMDMRETEMRLIEQRYYD